MYLKLDDNQKSSLRYPSLSLNLKVVFDNYRVRTFKSLYNNKTNTVKEKTFKTQYRVKFGDTTYKFVDIYYINKKHVFRTKSFLSEYISYSLSEKRIRYKSGYHFSVASKREHTLTFRSIFKVKFGYVKRTVKFKSGYKNDNVNGRVYRFKYYDYYSYQKTKKSESKYIGSYISTHVKDAQYRFTSEYRNDDSFLLNISEGYTVDASGGKIIIDPEILKLNIAKDKIRVFLNMPPLFINYCFTMDSQFAPIAVEDSKYVINISNILSRVSVDISDLLPYISLSIYRHNTEKVDTRVIKAGNIFVSENVYDHNVFSNLLYKRIDVRDESIHKGKSSIVPSDSQLWNIKIRNNGECCLNRVIKIKSGKVSCYIPNITIRHNVNKMYEDTTQQSEFIANGFRRIPSGYVSERRISEIIEKAKKSKLDEETGIVIGTEPGA